MAGLDHPLYGSHYEPESDGTVRVTEPDGRVGWFTWQGRCRRGKRHGYC